MRLLMFRDFTSPNSACWKGGGGGGSSSGVVDYPDYMKFIHTNMLTGSMDTTTTILHFTASNALLNLIENAIPNSPYIGEVGYNPDSNIAAFITSVAQLESQVEIADGTTWDSLVTSAATRVDAVITTSASINATTTAHAAILDDRLTTEVLPRFQAGMRDINAVNSSSFVIGQTILEAFNTREVADFDAKLRMAAQSQRNDYVMVGMRDQLALLQAKISFRQQVAALTVEANRIKSVLKKEELADTLDFDDKNVRWGIDLFQAGANVLGSIAGSSVSTARSHSSGMSMLGGALSGAASGAMIGGPAGIGAPMGAGIGAIVGGLGSLF